MVRAQGAEGLGLAGPEEAESSTPKHFVHSGTSVGPQNARASQLADAGDCHARVEKSPP